MKNYKSIFLVDDDDASNFLSQRIIDEMKITEHTSTFENGKDALDFMAHNCCQKEIISELCPELILLDINMPVMDGFQFLSEFQSAKNMQKEKVKIYILTSSNNPNDIEKAKNYSVSGYINKPITKEKLLKALE